MKIYTMTFESTQASFVASVACAACLLCLCFPHLSFLMRSRRSSDSKHHHTTNIYEDKDGRASEESQAAFSDFVPRFLLIIETLTGLALAAASAVLTSTRSETSSNSHLIIQQWLQFTSWVR